MRPPSFAAPGLAALLLGCSATGEIPRDIGGGAAGAPTPAAAPAACEDRDPLRRVFFGDLHVHTAFSADAYVFGTRNLPDDAYRFARGGAIDVRTVFAGRSFEDRLRLERPLDFAAVTDHAEYLGSASLCTDPGSPVHGGAVCTDYRESWGGQTSMEEVVRTVGRVLGSMNGAEICGPEGARCRAAAVSPWRATREAAERWNEPCAFTAFTGYEYSPAPRQSKVHRNVIFRSAAVLDAPVSAVEEPSAPGLWRRLRAECLDAGNGCDALAIPHNPNLSNGQMFAPDYGGAQTRAAQAEVARLRARLEPLVEMMQMKGDSECRTGMWNVAGDPDPLCGFEKYRDFPRPPDEDCRDGSGGGALLGRGCVSRLDYVRYALLEGLRERARLGVNPYPFGFVGSTDAHDGTAGDVEEWSRDGRRRAVDPLVFGRGNPGGLAAVWAEENTRAALFDAMRRRETYATSGPRMVVRFFGGWDYPADLCARGDLAARGYAGGVPMGGELPPAPAGAGAPVFAVSALRDPGTAAHPGGRLERVQIVKGWVEAGDRFHQRVVDVAGAPAPGAEVDPATCEPRGPGRDALCAVWRDPAFDPTRPAVYYARVLESPSCRYSARACRNLPPERRPPACGDPRLPDRIQERAWTSPIWFSG